MTHKSRNKKRVLSRRKKNKINHLGGASPYLLEINTLITNMNNDDPDNTLSKLEKYANFMTIQHTYDLINHTVNDLEELKQSSNLLKTYFENYPNLLKNIQKLITILIPSSIEVLNTQYSTFPISKINPKLGEIKDTGDKSAKVYDDELYKLVGTGGYGSVYVNLDTNQAIKKIEINLYSQDLFKSDAINYNNISSLLCNTNYFCKFKNCFIDLRLRILYVLMEYCGKDLITTINELKKSQNLSFKTLLQWFITIAKGIQCMHDNGYVHLDIKPRNITIYNNEAKLIDFGLANYIDDINSIEQLGGTEHYMAPEISDIIEGMADSIDGIDYKTCDIYSLGMTFAYCISISLNKKNDVLTEDENTDEEDLEDNTEDEYDDKVLLSFIGLESMVSDNPSGRPTIQYVINQLTSVSTDIFFKNMTQTLGHSIADLRDVGFNPVDLHDGGFNLLDIFIAGYNYGEIRNIYKKNKYSNLAALLRYCGKKREGFKRHTLKDCTINTICSTNPHLPECKKRSVNRRSFSSSSKSMGSKKSLNKSSGVFV